MALKKRKPKAFRNAGDANIRLHAKEHRLAKIAAATAGESMQTWIGEAIRMRLGKSKTRK